MRKKENLDFYHFVQVLFFLFVFIFFALFFFFVPLQLFATNADNETETGRLRDRQTERQTNRLNDVLMYLKSSAKIFF